MGCPAETEIGSNLTFSIKTHDPDTGILTDADGAPAYRIYEDETAVPILTGTMSKLDDDNTTGLYAETIECSAANGFESDKTYTIDIEAAVDGNTGGISYAFKVKDYADILETIKDISEGDMTIDTTATPWQIVIKKKGTDTELIRKNLKDVNGNNITDVTTVIGQQLEP